MALQTQNGFYLTILKTRTQYTSETNAETQEATKKAVTWTHLRAWGSKEQKDAGFNPIIHNHVIVLDGDLTYTEAYTALKTKDIGFGIDLSTATHI